jgi:hypothetical protein
MEKMMNEKQQLLAALRAAFNNWEALLAGLGDARITARQLSDGWSIKDVMGHLHAWQQRSIARLEAALGDHEPRFPNWPAHLDPETADEPHELNDWLYQRYRDRPWPDVYQQWRDGFLRFLELAAAIPAAALSDADRYPWLEGYTLADILLGSLNHHIEHFDTLRAWLEQQEPGQ